MRFRSSRSLDLSRAAVGGLCLLAASLGGPSQVRANSPGPVVEVPLHVAEVPLYEGCFEDFRSFPGKMFVSYDAFISEKDLTTDDGRRVTSLRDALVNDRRNLHAGPMPETEDDGYDDYFDLGRLDELRDIKLVPYCLSTPREGRDHAVSLIGRLMAGEKMQLRLKLFHLEDGSTGVLASYLQ